LMRNNDYMRVIAVGDDDQNIYEFRGSDSANMQALNDEYGAVRYEMVENYRSKANIVALANNFVTTVKNRMKQMPVAAVKSELGTVSITHHASDYLEEPVVKQLCETYSVGKACVLTNTNEEALRVLGLLNRNGIRAKLIQSMDGFRLYNLAEIRFFLKAIDRRLGTSPIISQDIWNQAKKELQQTYSDSGCLENINNMISEFESVNTYRKYRTDLEEFIKESKYEDFYSDDRQTVFVSTIHKSKGREFDSVYMLLSNISLKDDAARRQLYVGMTRAKENLYIHCNVGIFNRIQIDGVEQLSDGTRYTAPEEIMLQLTHKDVVLDYFKGKKEIIFKLRSAQKLSLNNEFITAEIDGRTVRVARLSKACLENMEMLKLKNYHPISAQVRFIVAWKGEEDTDETAVLLADLLFSKNK